MITQRNFQTILPSMRPALALEMQLKIVAVEGGHANGVTHFPITATIAPLRIYVHTANFFSVPTRRKPNMQTQDVTG